MTIVKDMHDLIDKLREVLYPFSGVMHPDRDVPYRESDPSLNDLNWEPASTDRLMIMRDGVEILKDGAKVNRESGGKAKA